MKATLPETIEIYRKHYRKLDKVSEELLTILMDAISKYAYIDDISLLHAGRDIIEFMASSTVNTFNCTDPTICKALLKLNWDLSKMGSLNIYNYFRNQYPTRIEIINPQTYCNIKTLISKFEVTLNWSEHNNYNIYLNYVFQLLAGYSLEKILAFSNFTIKGWNSIAENLAKTLNDSELSKESKIRKEKPGCDKPDPMAMKTEEQN